MKTHMGNHDNMRGNLRPSFQALKVVAIHTKKFLNLTPLWTYPIQKLMIYAIN